LCRGLIGVWPDWGMPACKSEDDLGYYCILRLVV